MVFQGDPVPVREQVLKVDGGMYGLAGVDDCGS